MFTDILHDYKSYNEGPTVFWRTHQLRALHVSCVFPAPPSTSAALRGPSPGALDPPPPLLVLVTWKHFYVILILLKLFLVSLKKAPYSYFCNLIVSPVIEFGFKSILRRIIQTYSSNAIIVSRRYLGISRLGLQIIIIQKKFNAVRSFVEAGYRG